MKRLWRIAMKILATISSLLLVAFIWLWLTGYIKGWEGAWLDRDADGLGYSHYGFEVSGGGIALEFARYRVLPNETAFARVYRSIPNNPPNPNDRGIHRTLGNDYPDPPGWANGQRLVWDISISRPYSIRHGYIIMPCWLIALIMASCPGLSVMTRFRNKKRRGGICAQCGYDLRATPNRCPECGTVPARKTKISD